MMGVGIETLLKPECAVRVQVRFVRLGSNPRVAPKRDPAQDTPLRRGATEMKSSRAVPVVALAMTLVVTAVSAAQISPTKYKGLKKIYEFQPTVNDTYFAWSQNSLARPRHFNSWYEPIDHSVVRKQINAAGTDSYMGTLNGNEGSFQEITSGTRRSHSNIYFYDVSTDTRTRPPTGVNTKYWEWSPSSSPGFILFGRNQFGTGKSPWEVILYDRTNETFTTLARVSNNCGCIHPEAVTDSFATWTRCSSGHVCQVFYYDIANATTHRVPNPLRKPQYTSAITSDSGSIYYVRHGYQCGGSVKIMRFDIGTTVPVVVASLPKGIDSGGSIFAYTDGSSHDHVYFSELACSNGSADIYVIDDAETASLAIARSWANANRARQSRGPSSAKKWSRLCSSSVKGIGTSRWRSGHQRVPEQKTAPIQTPFTDVRRRLGLVEPTTRSSRDVSVLLDELPGIGCIRPTTPSQGSARLL